MEQRIHKGLSPSSLAVFTACQRKYFHSKIAKTPKDPDVSDDMENLQVGSAFHQCLEDTAHELGGYEYGQLLEVLGAHGLDESYGPMLYAMLQSYKSLHERAGLKAIHCEVEVETETFYGFVDVILADKEGNWWIGDNKTAGSTNQDLVPTLFSHPQLNLYAANAPEIAKLLGLDLEKFKGCRYRNTLKSKLIRKGDEPINEYIQRMRKVIKSYDYIIPRERLNTSEISAVHKAAFDYIEANRHSLDPTKFAQNFGNCWAWRRPCENYSQCHKHTVTELRTIESVVSE